MYNLLKQLFVDIKNCYGSFSEPDWSFLKTRRNMYQAVINDLNQNETISSFFSMENKSDYMDFGYGPILYLLHDDQAWWLYLSFVGKYAFFVKMLEGLNYKDISSNEDCDIPEEIEILAILKNHTVIPLTRQIVYLQIPEFKLREYISGPIEIPTINNILFCDV
ncbi:MAG: hypothetical protein LBC02_10750 [Planctomycetaceae bacterium]|jgi:hypothetical protein|nr:hypothetical protein [Planctomycetaceae bacterium]